MSTIYSRRSQNVITKLQKKQSWLRNETPKSAIPLKTPLKKRYRSETSESSVDEGHFSEHESDEDLRAKSPKAIKREGPKRLATASTKSGLKKPLYKSRSVLRKPIRSKISKRKNVCTFPRSLSNQHLNWIKTNVSFARGSLLLFSLVFSKYRKTCSEAGIKPMKSSRFAKTITNCFRDAIASKNQSKKLSFLHLKLSTQISGSILSYQTCDVDNRFQSCTKDDYSSRTVPAIESTLKQHDKIHADSDDSGIDSSETEVDRLVIHEPLITSKVHEITPQTSKGTIQDTPMSSEENSQHREDKFETDATAKGDQNQNYEYQTKLDSSSSITAATPPLQEAIIKQEPLTPLETLSKSMSELLSLKTGGYHDPKCVQERQSIIRIFCKMIENNLLGAFLATFAHSASCANDSCNKICQMFRRMRCHIQSDKKPDCPLRTLYGEILRLHLDSCAKVDCGLQNCQDLKKLRPQRLQYSTVEQTV